MLPAGHGWIMSFEREGHRGTVELLLHAGNLQDGRADVCVGGDDINDGPSLHSWPSGVEWDVNIGV